MKPLFVVRCQIMALMLDFIWKTHTKGYITLGVCVCVFTLLKKNYENFESSE